MYPYFNSYYIPVGNIWSMKLLVELKVYIVFIFYYYFSRHYLLSIYPLPLQPHPLSPAVTALLSCEFFLFWGEGVKV